MSANDLKLIDALDRLTAASDLAAESLRAGTSGLR